MRSPINVVKKVAITLYYLRVEGRFRKTANAFNLVFHGSLFPKYSHCGQEYIHLPTSYRRGCKRLSCKILLNLRLSQVLRGNREFVFVFFNRWPSEFSPPPKIWTPRYKSASVFGRRETRSASGFIPSSRIWTGPQTRSDRSAKL